jgi:hypothetical protein
MSVLTFESIMGLHSIEIPAHLCPSQIPPVEHYLCRQGDVYARAEPYDLTGRQGFPAHHINVVQGDAVRNSHILHCETGFWYPGHFRDQVRDYGVLVVPEDDYGYLTHTGEHGSLALAPGTWRLFGQAEIRESDIRRVKD